MNVIDAPSSISTRSAPITKISSARPITTDAPSFTFKLVVMSHPPSQVVPYQGLNTSAASPETLCEKTTSGGSSGSVPGSD